MLPVLSWVQVSLMMSSSGVPDDWEARERVSWDCWVS